MFWHASFLLALLPMVLRAEGVTPLKLKAVVPEARLSDAVPLVVEGPVDSTALNAWMRDVDQFLLRFRATGLLFDNRALEARVSSGYVSFKLRTPHAQSPAALVDYGALVALPTDQKRWDKGGLLAMGAGAVFERGGALGRFRIESYALLHAYRHAASQADGAPSAELQFRAHWEMRLRDERFTLAVPCYFGWVQSRDAGASAHLESWLAPALRFRFSKMTTFAAEFTTANLFAGNGPDFGKALREGTWLATASFTF